MTTLLTGGTGQTSTAIAKHLLSFKKPYLITFHSREPSSNSPSVKFSWTDESTWPGLFEKAPDIRNVYLCAFNQVPDHVLVALKFIDFCIGRGAKRFVLLLGSTAEVGGPNGGEIWSGLIERGVEYAVLLPTWFMENFLFGGLIPHHKTITQEDKLYSACGDGKCAMVSVEDIGEVGYHALTDDTPHNCSHRLYGPEALSHDKLAKIMSEILVRTITHIALATEERIKQLSSAGLPDQYAQFIAFLERRTAQGTEDHTNDVVQRIAGREGITWRDFVERHKEIWKKHVEG